MNASNTVSLEQGQKENNCCSQCVCGSCTPVSDALPGLPAGFVMKSREEIVGYSFPSLVRRLEKELELTAVDAEMLYRSMLQFLFLAAHWRGKKSFYPPPMIDKAWHEFVVHTMDYYKFCKLNFGFFLHHVPFNDENKDLQARVESAKPQAVLHFGELSKFWIEDGKDCSQCGDCSPVACGHR